MLNATRGQVKKMCEIEKREEKVNKVPCSTEIGLLSYSKNTESIHLITRKDNR